MTDTSENTRLPSPEHREARQTVNERVAIDLVSVIGLPASGAVWPTLAPLRPESNLAESTLPRMYINDGNRDCVRIDRPDQSYSLNYPNGARVDFDEHQRMTRMELPGTEDAILYITYSGDARTPESVSIGSNTKIGSRVISAASNIEFSINQGGVGNVSIVDSFTGRAMRFDISGETFENLPEGLVRRSRYEHSDRSTTTVTVDPTGREVHRVTNRADGSGHSVVNGARFEDRFPPGTRRVYRNPNGDFVNFDNVQQIQYNRNEGGGMDQILYTANGRTFHLSDVGECTNRQLTVCQIREIHRGKK